MTDDAVIRAMEIFGGSFVQALAAAARCADPVNLAKIQATWPEVWRDYQVIAAHRGLA